MIKFPVKSSKFIIYKKHKYISLLQCQKCPAPMCVDYAEINAMTVYDFEMEMMITMRYTT